MHKLRFLPLIFAFLFVVSATSPLFAQQTWHFVTAKKVVYLKTRDEALEKALREWSGEEKPYRYFYNTVDLNADGKLDALVSIWSANYCGSGGCPILIFKGDGEKYELLTEMSVSHEPIFVGATKTKGWSDLVMNVYGGGIKPYYALLKFDGKSYPENPTVEPALPRKSKAKFIEYLSGVEDVEKGFEIK